MIAQVIFPRLLKEMECLMLASGMGTAEPRGRCRAVTLSLRLLGAVAVPTWQNFGWFVPESTLALQIVGSTTPLADD